MISATSLLCSGAPPPKKKQQQQTNKQTHRDLPLHHRTSFWVCMTFNRGIIRVNLSSTLYNFSEIHKTGSFRLGLTPVQQPVLSDCHIRDDGQLSSKNILVPFVVAILCVIFARQCKEPNIIILGSLGNGQGHEPLLPPDGLCANLSDKLLMHY